MTEASERERQRERDEAEAMRYSDETRDAEMYDRETGDYDRTGDRAVDDGADGSRSDRTAGYDRADEAQARADEVDRDLAGEDRGRPDLDMARAQSDPERSGLGQPGQDGHPAETLGQPDGGNASLVDDPSGLMSRWQEVQTGFVDDPRHALQAADGLVQQVMQQVGQRLATERSGLEQVWSRGGDVSTEDLRQALQQYRSFFNRLLQV